jgi:uncharacterized protein (TIGR00661 family)
MSRIFYSVGGEGRGHATRVRAVVEELRNEHEIVIYASNQAFELLAPVYALSKVKVLRIPGFSNFYSKSRKLDYWKTGYHGTRFVLKIPQLIKKMQQDIEEEKPDLIITDYEPSLPRAALRCGVPFISINHQHFLLTYDLSSLPLFLQRHAAFMAQIVRRCHWGQTETVVSSFYFPPLKHGCEDVKQIGVLLRPEVIQAIPQNGEHLVVYLRRFATSSVLKTLKGVDREMRIYGLGAKPPDGNLRFLGVDVYQFAENLATSCGLICTAGNQLVGEALYLGKPVLAMPEKNNFEQSINAFFLKESGAGQSVEMEDLSPEIIHEFLDKLQDYRLSIDRERLYGNPVAKAVIERHLSKKTFVSHPKIRIPSQLEGAL